jgi:phosphoribosyl 1,2-cyclic phosphodiesterase
VNTIVRFHGTRGSIPTPEPGNAVAGGDTSCVEVEAGGSRLILDAGTGIRRLGATLAGVASGAPMDIFLTHFHWDHVQGLPFFAPLHDPGARVRIFAPCQEDLGVADLLGGRLAPVYFPVPYSAFAAQCTTHALDDGPVESGPFEIHSIRVCHPSNTHGLRVRCGDVVIAYIPDNELGEPGARGLPCLADRGRSTAYASYAALCSFVEGADLLIHDAMFTNDEYAGKRGWGHSTYGQALRLAQDAGVAELRFFHHDPDRDDVALDAIVADVRRNLERQGSPLRVDAARDGQTVTPRRAVVR